MTQAGGEIVIALVLGAAMAVAFGLLFWSDRVISRGDDADPVGLDQHFAETTAAEPEPVVEVQSGGTWDFDPHGYDWGRGR